MSGQRQWNSTLKRGKGLKRGGGPKPKPGRRTGKGGGVNRVLETPLDVEIANRHIFHDAARRQRVCAVTGERGAFQAHHVIYEQHLKDENLPVYDARNALRVTPLAHGRHHKGHRRIKTRELTDDNIEYAFEKLGPKAADYFRRYYDDTDPDPRIVRHEQPAAV